MKRMMLYGLALTAVLGLGACDRHPAPANTAPSSTAVQPGLAPKPVATIREIMDAEIDPSADAIWDSVGTIYDKRGITELRPKTDEEWRRLRRSAVTLVEATNLIAMDGREAAKPSPETDKEAQFGVLKPEQAQAKIRAEHDSFVGYAAALQEISLQTLKMIDNRDVNGLKNIGEDLDNACESCHVTYWYPKPEK